MYDLHSTIRRYVLYVFDVRFCAQVLCARVSYIAAADFR